MTDDDRVQGVRCYHWVPKAGPRNFGDELGPLIIRQLLAERGVRRDGDTPAQLMSVGSVLHFARPGDTVWGSGVNGKVRPQQIAPALDVRSVRGPLTRAVLLAQGITVPEVYGDPALLMPRVIPIEDAGSGGGGTVVVPNLNDLDGEWGDDVLSPLGDPEEVIRAIAGADLVIASSLHGLIIADAYGVPSRPVVSEAEHPFKYLDYYAGTGRTDVRFARDVAEAEELGGVAPARFDADALAAAFPYDLWQGVRTATPALSWSETAEAAREARERIELVGEQGETALRRLDELCGDARQDLSHLTREAAEELGAHAPHLARRRALGAPDLTAIVVARDAERAVVPTVGRLLDDDAVDEVVVAVAASADATPAAVADLDDSDPRLRILWARGGEAEAIDLGLEYAAGRFVRFVRPSADADAFDAGEAARRALAADAPIAADERRRNAVVRRRFLESRGLRATTFGGADALLAAAVERADHVADVTG